MNRDGDGSSTFALRRQGVVRSLEAMRMRLADQVSLEYLARTAGMSRFHFVRVFHDVTGLPPFQFLSAMRLAWSRDLVLNTVAPITAICFEVGYNSLGTFTRRFTASVGASPMQLRRFSGSRNKLTMKIQSAASPELRGPEADIVVHCQGMSDDARMFVGAFPSPVPIGRPKACVSAAGASSVVLRDVPLGSHYILAAAGPVNSIAAGVAGVEMLVGIAHPAPILIENRCTQEMVVQLRPVEVTDPPIVSFLPLLFHECNMQPHPDDVAPRGPSAEGARVGARRAHSL